MAEKSKGKPVAVVIGATSKWQADGRNTRLIHGKAVDDSAPDADERVPSIRVRSRAIAVLLST